MIVCIGYAGGRWHTSWAPGAYWFGEVTLFATAAWVAFRRRSTWAQRVVAVSLYTVAQSGITWAYSPDRFRYADELQHLRSLLNVLHYHHLFHTNYSLPVSPFYPGLENVAAAGTQLTGISPFAAASITAGAAHLLLTIAVLALYRRGTGDDRIAGGAGLIYAVGVDQALTRLFVYESLALPFLVLTLYLCLSPRTDVRPTRAAILGMCSACAVVFTHHVTAIALAVILIVVGIILACLRAGAARAVLVVGFGTALVVALWIGVAARQTLTYLGTPLTDALTGAFSGHSAGASTVVGQHSGPLEAALAYAGPALTVVLVPVGAFGLLRTGKQIDSAVMRVLGVASLSFYVALGVRVAVANGTELAGRALAYTSLFTAVALAWAGCRLLDGRQQPALGDRRRPLRRIAATRGSRILVAAGLSILLVSGLVSAIPPVYERLPGQFHPDGFESGVDGYNIAAAQWSSGALGRGRPVFGDFTAYTLWGTLGSQNAIRGDTALVRAYEAPTLRNLRAPIRELGVRYIVTDTRQAACTPVTGSYFAIPDNAAGTPRTTPLPRAALRKFAAIPRVSQIYDNGKVRVYDLRGTSDAP